MYLHNLALRFRWFQLPTGMLIMLLQRSPVLRVIVQLEGMISNNATAIVRSAFAVAAMGAYNSVAGATVFNVTATPTAATPTSGAAKAVFAVTEASGTAAAVSVSVSGAPGNPKSYSVSGTIPAGLSLVNAVGTYVNVSAPYKMTISGTPTTAGTYPLTITAWDGSNGTGGNNAKITVNITVTGGVSTIAPSITTQPANTTVTAGASASLTVAASGTPTPTYQWQKGGVNIAGATNATYTIASTVTGDAGSYTAVATNSAGNATSNAATLTVNAAATAPAITTQPTSQSVTAGGSVSFTVAASGTPTPTYQWQKGGVNIAGATNATYTIASTVAGDAGSYTAVATNSVNSATSNAATLTVNAAATAPAITTQPTSQSVTAGGSVSFTVAASGTPTPTYQWQKGGVNIAGATNATYTIASTVAGDAGSYSAVATNSVNSATSNSATLTVNAAATAPAITTQPTSQSVTAGGSVSFTVAASGTPTPTYQWKKGGVNIAGATNATYTIASTVAGDAGSYTAVATNSVNSATSNTATLTVSAAAIAPAITTQPTSQTVTTGGAVSFTVAASGTPTPTYQWKKGGVNIAGATNATYTIASTVAGDAGSYTAVATNSVNSATSNTATLTVSAAAIAPAITTQPTSQTVTAGGSVSFTVAASGTPTPTYQWKKGGVNIAGATNATYTIASTVAGDAGSYTAVATNSVNSATSNAATLTVNPITSAPLITTQPVNKTTTAGGSVTFTAAASGTPTPTCQWRKNGVAISGATNTSLVLPNVQAGDAATYTFVATNSVGSATSNGATFVLDAIPAGFNATAYLARYPDVAAIYGTDLYGAWIYYRDVGIYQGEVFDELFRVEEYLALYPELAALFGTNLSGALLHWLETGRIEGRLGRIPLEFNAAGYFARNPDVAVAVGSDPILAWGHFWAYGIYEGRAYDDELRVFEYLALNPDLQTAFLTDWRGGALHWMRYGRAEGRLGRVPLVFGVAYYLAHYPEVAATWGTNPSTVWQHYWMYGIDEGRVFDDVFRVDEYLAMYPDLAAIFGTDRRKALMHWVRYGQSEGRLGRNP